MKKTTALIILVLIIGMVSCKKPTVTSTIPTLSFLGYKHFYDINYKDTTGYLKMYFTDGNGDIGMNQGESGVDFYSALWYKKNGVWTSDTLNYNFRLPYLVGLGGTGTMKGEVDIIYNKIIVTSIPHDSIKFQCYISDRAGNNSLKVFTDEVDLVH